MKFILKAGRHIGPAPGWTLTEDGQYEKDGQKVAVRPDVTYGQGEAGGVIVEDERDLVKLLGKEKFAYAKGSEPQQEELGELAPKDLSTTKVSVHPAGQVVEGHQVSTTAPDGTRVSGAMTTSSIPKTAEEKRSMKEDGEGGKQIVVDQKPFHVQSQEQYEEEQEQREEAAKQENTSKEPQDFGKMTVAELRQYARDNDIPLEGASTKQEIINAISDAENQGAEEED